MAQSSPSGVSTPGAAAPKKSTRKNRSSGNVDIQLGSAQAEASMRFVHSIGFVFLTPEERALIERLRLTTKAGRAIVHDMARVIQCRHPWIDGDLDHNTSPAL